MSDEKRDELGRFTAEATAASKKANDLSTKVNGDMRQIKPVGPKGADGKTREQMHTEARDAHTEASKLQKAVAEKLPEDSMARRSRIAESKHSEGMAAAHEKYRAQDAKNASKKADAKAHEAKMTEMMNWAKQRG